VEEVSALVADAGQPVVMFALEWCEFCWSVRKVLAKFGIAYRSVDLDSVAYQQDNRGGKLREALRAKTGCNTFPQIFIGGEFIGGCTELFDGLKDGKLAERLQRKEIPFDTAVKVDPYSYLPGWLHPR
jgi:cysteine synthase A